MSLRLMHLVVQFCDPRRDQDGEDRPDQDDPQLDRPIAAKTDTTQTAPLGALLARAARFDPERTEDRQRVLQNRTL
jgi:hypothetical protein